jgi:DNA-binding PadR family transcriptional regulator
MAATASPTPAEAQVLLALLDGDAHGYVIMQRIAEQSDGRTKLGPGTLYTAIARLTERGWLQESSSSTDADDARRRYYRLTGAGRAVLQEEIRNWSRLASIGRRRLSAKGG